MVGFKEMVLFAKIRNNKPVFKFFLEIIFTGPWNGEI